MNKELTPIIETLQELVKDDTIPRNVKSKLSQIQENLKRDSVDLSIKVNQALNDLDEISGDTNLQPFTRTQIWNITTLLESL